MDEIVVREAVPSSETVRDRFGAVDGLRAVAILAVIAYEVVRLAPGLVARNAAAAAVAFDASQGLTLFLIVSGFALAYPALVATTENGRAHLDLGRYIVKRVLRIYPAYLLALVLALVVPPLALRYGLPALAGGSQTVSPSDFWSNVFFAGDGLGNDGFRALAIFARCYIAFPILILIWSRTRAFFPAVLLAATILDLVTGLHAIGIGALLPFGLGIVAAEVRAQSLPAYRFGTLLAIVGGVLGARFGHGLADLANAHASGALRIDPFYAIGLFGLVTAIGALDPLERILSFAPLRLLGVTSFAISLVVVPVSAFAIRQLEGPFGTVTAAINAAVASLVIGFVLYRFIDRSFAEGALRRDAAAKVGPFVGSLLGRVRAQRIVLGGPPVAVAAEIVRAPAEVAFYAPPPRPNAGDLAVVSTRTGSAEDLAAEILATKKRLSERSAAFFSEPVVLAIPVETEKPGFYRKPKATVTPQGPAETTLSSLPHADFSDHADVDHVDTIANTSDRRSIKLRINTSREETQLTAANDFAHDGRHD